MNEPVTVLKTAEDTVGMQLLRATLDEIEAHAAWRSFPEAKQKEVLYRVKAQITNAVQGAVRLIALGGFEGTAAKLKAISETEDGAKATLELSSIAPLSGCVGRRVVLMVVDMEDYVAGLDAIQAEADQHELPLEPEGETVTDAPEASTETVETVTPAETTVRQAETIRAASTLVGKLKEGWMLVQQGDNTYEAYSPDSTQKAAVWLAAARRVIDDATAVPAEGAPGRWLIPQQQAA
jgi:hypothetical protein